MKPRVKNQTTIVPNTYNSVFLFRRYLIYISSDLLSYSPSTLRSPILNMYNFNSSFHWTQFYF